MGVVEKQKPWSIVNLVVVKEKTVPKAGTGVRKEKRSEKWTAAT